MWSAAWSCLVTGFRSPTLARSLCTHCGWCEGLSPLGSCFQADNKLLGVHSGSLWFIHSFSVFTSVWLLRKHTHHLASLFLCLLGIGSTMHIRLLSFQRFSLEGITGTHLTRGYVNIKSGCLSLGGGSNFIDSQM